MHQGSMSDADLAMGGIPPHKKAKYEDMRRFKVWQEHWDVFKLYLRMRTQWRTTFGGVIGLDYMPIFHELDRMDLPKSEYDGYFRCIQVLESADLGEMVNRANQQN